MLHLHLSQIIVDDSAGVNLKGWRWKKTEMSRCKRRIFDCLRHKCKGTQRATSATNEVANIREDSQIGSQEDDARLVRRGLNRRRSRQRRRQQGENGDGELEENISDAL